MAHFITSSASSGRVYLENVRRGAKLFSEVAEEVVVVQFSGSDETDRIQI